MPIAASGRLVVNPHEKEDKDKVGHIAKLIFSPVHF